jgi:hypothetical protein
MSYTVTETVTAAQVTAVISESTTWDAFPRLWPSLLGEVLGGRQGERCEVDVYYLLR